MNHFLFAVFRQFAFAIAIFPAIALAASPSAGRPDTDTKFELESLKSAQMDLKENHRELKVKYEELLKNQLASDKIASEAKFTVNAYTDTFKSVVIPLIAASIAGLLAISVGIYYGVAWIVRRLAERLLRDKAGDVLEEIIKGPVSQELISSVARIEATSTAKKVSTESIELLSKIMVPLTFLREDRQDLAESILQDITREMPALQPMLAKQQLLLVREAYRNRPSKQHCILEYAIAALAHEVNRGDAEVHAAHGDALRALGKIDEAIVALKRAIFLNSPSKHVHQWTLAYCLLKKGARSDMAEAIEAARYAYSRLPDNRSVKLTLINCLAHSDVSDNILQAKQLVISILQEDKKKNDAIKALKVWHGINEILKEKNLPEQYEFAQLLPSTTSR